MIGATIFQDLIIKNKIEHAYNFTPLKTQNYETIYAISKYNRYIKLKEEYAWGY